MPWRCIRKCPHGYEGESESESDRESPRESKIRRTSITIIQVRQDGSLDVESCLPTLARLISDHKSWGVLKSSQGGAVPMGLCDGWLQSTKAALRVGRQCVVGRPSTEGLDFDVDPMRP